MLRKYALTVVFLFVVCGAAAQLPDDEYYPYGTGYEQRTPIVLTDSSLFYRAIQTMPDLYGSISAFNLPYIALGRRGQHYSSEAASFPGWGISSRYFGSLRLLGAREERRAGIAALPEAIGGAGGVRTFPVPRGAGRTLLPCLRQLSPTATTWPGRNLPLRGLRATAGMSLPPSRPARGATCTSKASSRMP